MGAGCFPQPHCLLSGVMRAAQRPGSSPAVQGEPGSPLPPLLHSPTRHEHVGDLRRGGCAAPPREARALGTAGSAADDTVTAASVSEAPDRHRPGPGASSCRQPRPWQPPRPCHFVSSRCCAGCRSPIPCILCFRSRKGGQAPSAPTEARTVPLPRNSCAAGVSCQSRCHGRCLGVPAGPVGAALLLASQALCPAP